MYRDPSEFRERFKAYKDGKSVREIYGLPGYEPGKLPVEEMMPYILAVENPTKQGLVNGVWRPPTDSTKWDVHAIGGGLDIREQHNPIVYNYLKTNGRLANPFLTAREEEVLRERVFKKTMLPALQNVYNKYGDKISSKGYARLAGMKWQGHPFLMAISPDSVTGKAFIKAIESGDKDLDSVFDAYYKYPANAKRYAARIQADTNYWKNHNTVATKPVPQEPIIARQDATRVATTIPQEKTIPIADPRNATIAEAQRAMWAHDVMNNIQGMAYDVPIWESKSLPALEPIELDTTPLKTYGDGKVSQGHKQIPIDKAHGWARHHDADEPWYTRYTKNVTDDILNTIESFTEPYRNAVNGRMTVDDVVNIGLDLGAGIGAKAIHRAAKAIKPTKASTKFKTNNPNVVGRYYKEHPEEVTAILDSPELNNAIRFAEEYTAPRYKRMNKVQVGIDPSTIKLGSADFSGTNLGAIAGPDGEIILNNSILGNKQLMEDVIAHEFNGHWFNKHYPINASQASAIQYGLPFKETFLNSRPYFDKTEEGLAVYRSLQNIASRDFGITGKELDNFMKNPPQAWLKRTLPRLGYGDAIDWKWPDLLPLRQISSSVPAAGAGIYLAGNEEYKNGKLPGYYEGELPMGEKKQLTDEEVKQAAQNASHEYGMSGEDPLMSMLVGMKAVRLVGDQLAERRLKEKAEMYKRWREANEQTRGASRAWKMQDADRMARNWGYSDNPLGFLYDVFLDPIANMYTKIQKHPILGPLIPFNDGKLPEYKDGKIAIKPSKRGTFTAAAKKHGASVREFESRVLKNPEKYSKAMVKKARFSRNARSWKH